ncbi:MAG TPA: discoidin domain-containing protein [Candidatus Baltobacteraceae bacterium]
MDTTHRVQTIRPLRALGTSVDSDPKGHLDQIYSPANTQLMLSTGLGTLTYRLYTELSIQDWHWNPNGTFSDASNKRGYWTSSATPSDATISDSFGYRLPRRGSSRDQGADDGYSRIDDGDSSTYWKSDPYLSHAYTGEPDSANPQWIVTQFLAPQRIDAVRVHWMNPYATRYSVQYWTGAQDVVLHPSSAEWKTFSSATVTNGGGGIATIRLATTPVKTPAVRVLMTRSSGSCDANGRGDPRNCAGYAVEDLGVGRIDAAGRFQDLVVRSKYGSCHGAEVCTPDPKRQTLMWTSSTDPWHDDTDKVTNDQDQPGLDLIARSPLTRGLPTIYPVAVFYSTPENAANEVRYMEARHYPIAYIEMGEEVDGQYALPEDYGALYIQFAQAIHAVDRNVKLGGPIFEGVNDDERAWPNASGDTSWLHRFIAYLKRRGHLRDLAFMSYEHYPFHNCDSGALRQDDLVSEPALVRHMAQTWRADGVPANVPLLETEDNFSADGTGAPQRVYGALWTGDFFGASLASGISYATFYQAEPEPLDFNERCKTWGAYNPYMVDEHYTVQAKGAAYYALQLITRDWALPGDDPHGVYPVATSLGDNKPLVTAYALKRPDGTWSILVVNKDTATRVFTVEFDGAQSRRHFAGTVHFADFGRHQFGWTGRNPADPPNPDLGVIHATRFKLNGSTRFAISPASLEVLSGKIDPN